LRLIQLCITSPPSNAFFSKFIKELPAALYNQEKKAFQSVFISIWAERFIKTDKYLVKHFNKTYDNIKKEIKLCFFSINQDGKLHQLADYAGISGFLLSKANTPGCTAEACDLRDNFDRFQANNYELLGVSADAAKAQAKFKDKYNFLFHYSLMRISPLLKLWRLGT
jgi:hypothetical protein